MLSSKDKRTLTLAALSTPAKALVTCILVTLAFGMIGALGQIIVHDIIPTFYAPESAEEHSVPSSDDSVPDNTETDAAGQRGDLFAELAPAAAEPSPVPFYREEQFVWTLKWTHIHLFGMNTIFILLGAVTLLLDAGTKLRTWLIVLPFAGVLVDILSMWLKGYVSNTFFWLHVPGGGLFAGIYLYVMLRALWEMWLKPARP